MPEHPSFDEKTTISIFLQAHYTPGELFSMVRTLKAEEAEKTVALGSEEVSKYLASLLCAMEEEKVRALLSRVAGPHQAISVRYRLSQLVLQQTEITDANVARLLAMALLASESSETEQAFIEAYDELFQPVDEELVARAVKVLTELELDTWVRDLNDRRADNIIRSNVVGRARFVARVDPNGLRSHLGQLS